MRNLKSLFVTAAICWGVFSVTAANANSILINPEPGASQQDNVTITTVSGTIFGLLAPGWPATTPTASTTDATGFVLTGQVAARRQKPR